VIDIGSVVNGKYRLVRLLGDGGMGSVYEAQHAVLGTRVAIKVLHPELARRTGLVERFLQEARVAAQIRSPHVVQVTDIDRTPDGHAYIVMELLEGEPLSGVLDRQRRLPVMTASEYTLQILQALEAAHALGVIHRDLKPENVFVTFAGGRAVLKLIDFGIAKARRTDPQQRNLTVAGVVMGTAEYMAPEQARSADRVDARADLYAVGVMLYEMIAGMRPVTGEEARVIAHKVERGEIVPLLQAAPDTPRELAGLVHHAMAARPELRFANATEMRLALEKAMSGSRPATAPPGAVAPHTTPPVGPAPVAGGPELTPTGTLKNLNAQQLLGAAHPATAAQAAAPQAHPATALIAHTPATPSSSGEPAPHTMRAPPVATALAPPAYGAVALPLAPATEPHAPRRGRTVALVALPLVLGAGIVGILIATGAWAPSSTPVEPLPLDTSGSGSGSDAGAAATSATSANGAPAAASIPSLAMGPTGVTPAGPPRPSPPRPAPGHEDAGLPPFVFPSALPSTLPPFPSTLPPFPSVIPLPAGFPTTFPSVLPPWPEPPDPTPQPTSKRSRAAPAGSGGHVCDGCGY